MHLHGRAPLECCRRSSVARARAHGGAGRSPLGDRPLRLRRPSRIQRRASPTSHDLVCTAVPIGAGATWSPQGDPSDLRGSAARQEAGARHHRGFHRAARQNDCGASSGLAAHRRGPRHRRGAQAVMLGGAVLERRTATHEVVRLPERMGSRSGARLGCTRRSSQRITCPPPRCDSEHAALAPPMGNVFHSRGGRPAPRTFPQACGPSIPATRPIFHHSIPAALPGRAVFDRVSPGRSGMEQS